MKKRVLIIGAAISLLAIGIPAVALATSKAISTTTFYACENPSNGVVDSTTITQNATVAQASGYCPNADVVVQWSVTGPQGPAGPKGDTGDKGDKGDKGDTGAQGIPGNQGQQGATGVAGPAGPTGPQGPIGNTGAQGATGVAGPAGPQGAPGISGYTVVQSEDLTVKPGQYVVATCPAGDVVLGGGGQVGGQSSNYALSDSQPASNNHAWRATYSSDNGHKTTLRVWAICAKVVA